MALFVVYFFLFFWNSGYRKKKQFTDGNKLMYLENYIPEWMVGGIRKI